MQTQDNDHSDAAPLSPSVERLMERVKRWPTTSQEQVDKMEAERKTRERQAMVDKIAAKVGARYSPERVRLDRFEVYDARQRVVLARVRECAANISEMIADGHSIILHGTVGTGKDHLLLALLYEAARAGFSCSWVNGQEVYGEFRDRMDTNRPENELLNELARPQVLAISDPIPPVGSPTGWNVGQLYRLLDRRYRAMTSTWVSLNALSVEDADEKLSQPVFDRLRDCAELLRCEWPSYRERSKKHAG
jgi:DNA replication protein DnaC